MIFGQNLSQAAPSIQPKTNILAPIQNRVLGFELRCLRLNLGSSGLPEPSDAGLPLSAGLVVENAERCRPAAALVPRRRRGAAARVEVNVLAMSCDAIVARCEGSFVIVRREY